MSFSVMLVVLFAALFHASWNFLVKNNSNKNISISAVMLGHVPFAILGLCFFDFPDINSFVYIIISALLHTGYGLFLSNSYKVGDLSQVYPLARGVAPLIVTIVSIFILGIDISQVELIAILIISVGIISLVVTRKGDGLRNFRAAIFAVITGIFIAGYSLIDGLGAKEANSPVGYFSCVCIINAITFMYVMSLKQKGILKTIIRKHYKLSLISGFSSFFAYSLIVWAFTVTSVPLVTALRETSIIFALFLGVFVLKEKFNLAKFFATFSTLIGVGLLKINK